MLELESVEADDCLSWIVNGATLITVNRRLTRDLINRYDLRQSASEQSLWATPQVFPFSTWLESIWYKYVESLDTCNSSEGPLPTLLTPFQSSLVWKNVIRTQSDDYKSKSDRELTQLAIKAWSLMNDWQIPQAQHYDDNPNVKAFNGWARTYSDVCAENGWIDNAVLPSKVLSLLAASVDCDQGLYIFAGFDEFTPKQKSLIQALLDRGDDVRVLSFPVVNNQIVNRVANDSDTELEAVANWAADIVGRKPEASVGIVVPDLAVQRPRVVRQLEKTLHATSRLNYGASKLCFNVTLGRPLIEYPIIRAIFVAFDLVKPIFDISEGSSFLLDAYLANSPDDINARAIIDCELRRVDEVSLHLNLVKSVVEKSRAGIGVDDLYRQLEVLAEFQGGRKNKFMPSQWCMKLTVFLQQLTWAEGIELSSEEYQQYTAWHKIMDQLSELDKVTGKINWSEVDGMLRVMTSEMIFQPEAEIVPIHVMGLFETAGLSFDYLWVMDMSDDTLPAKANPNPFIPIALQKELALPHSSSERELIYAESLIARLSVCAGEVVLSYARRDGEMEKRPSPLLDLSLLFDEVTCCEGIQGEGIDGAGVLKQVHSSGLMEWWVDRSTPVSSLIRESTREFKGGASIFKHQAACPFRAYVYLRLFANSIHIPEIGVNAMDRGVLIHGVLENFWREVKSHKKFMALNTQDLEAKVISLAVNEVATLAKRKPVTFTPRFRRMESERLKRRVMSWLDVERARLPFEVNVVEGKHEVEIAGLRLSTKIDRIDRLSDGTLFLIDYKTGQPKVSSWFGERPDDPQLPLYAVSSEEEIKGIAFAQLKVGGMTFKGLAEGANSPEGVESFSDNKKYVCLATTWAELLVEWAANLEKLARDFNSGLATVDPKEGGKTCQYCDLASVCRINMTVDNYLHDGSSHHAK